MDAPTRPAGNHYDKYNSRNPIARWLTQGFLDNFDRLAAMTGAPAALEVGCGEGELSLRLAKRGIAMRGCDISQPILQKASQRASDEGLAVDFWEQSIESLTPENSSPLVICCEVLEHIDHPQIGVDVLASLAKPFLLTSVPREPIWRLMNVARGRYLSQLGNTPGHINHWSTAQFLAMLRTRFEVCEVATPLPWTMALCKVR